MTAYATADDLRAFMFVDATILPDDEANRALGQASDDLDDRVFVAYTYPDPPLASGRKIDPTTLNTTQAAALIRACCAQGEYRLTMGDDFFIRAQHDSVSGPDFNTAGKLPYIGPKVKAALRGSGLQPTGARATTGGRRTAGLGAGGTPLPWPFDGTTGAGR